MAERQQWAETGLGALVLAAAIGFLSYALSHTAGGGGGGYTLNARFGEVGALSPGAAVSVAGVKVGTVQSVKLDPKTFLADTVMSIQPDIRLPSDSTVKITQDSLLGGQHLSVEPGGALDNLKPGGTFSNTQGAVDLFGLIGSVLRPQTGQTGKGAAPGATTPPAATPPDAASGPGG